MSSLLGIFFPTENHFGDFGGINCFFNDDQNDDKVEQSVNESFSEFQSRIDDGINDRLYLSVLQRGTFSFNDPRRS